MMRLLCVEDEAALREDIVQYLRMKSYIVDEAESGEDAIECLNQNQYDLVLCDIKMPRMDGYELLRQVRGENHLATTPFLFLSALTERDNKIRAHEHGCDAYLTKPIDFSVLDATLKSHIDRKRARDLLHTSALECSKRHMMTVIDSALGGPMAEASLILQHVQDTLPVLTPTALSVHIAHVQNKVGAHSNKLHTFYSALQLQSHSTQLMREVVRSSELLREAVADCIYHNPSSLVRYTPAPPPNPTLSIDVRLLKRAISGLLTCCDRAFNTGEMIDWAVSRMSCNT